MVGGKGLGEGGNGKRWGERGAGLPCAYGNGRGISGLPAPPIVKCTVARGLV
jgi:hypothetical protein